MHTSAPSRPIKPEIIFLSIAMMLIGALAILFFFFTVANDTAIQYVMSWVPTDADERAPSFVLIYLERFGIIVSALFVLAGLFFITIGWRLRTGSLRIAY